MDEKQLIPRFLRNEPSKNPVKDSWLDVGSQRMTMSFEFTEEQELFRKTIREFMVRNVAPKSKELLKARLVTPEIHKGYTDLGLFGLLVPTEYGGSEADFVTFLIAVEEMTKGDPSGFAGLPMWYGAVCARLVAAYGSPELKQEILPQVSKQGWITPLHSTEPTCGTDFTAITSTAKKTDGEYVVNGEKTCLSCVPEVMRYGGGFITSVKTTSEAGSRGMSLLYIPSNSKGLNVSNYTGMGIDVGGVRYQDTHVPVKYLLGSEGSGYKMTYESFVHARVPTTMSIVAAAEASIERGIEFLKQRRAFGRPVGAHEGIQFELAEDYANVQASKLLCYRAGWFIDQYHRGKASFQETMNAASIAKLVASELCVKTVSDVLEWYGGLGTTTEYDIQQVYRTVRQTVIAEGTRHAQKIVIAMQLLGRDFTSW